ncbi:MAG: O-acetyl-ADP-ribose deacetylase [Candidatus Berkelbacteria bacterium]|nr:O-acetyl-ADP-ribose deacetylase [Candidatus Berkelbacteria bacterium]
MIKITAIKDSISTQKVDAIVNAANKTLSGGGGVDGAIHRAAGPQLSKECKALGGCETGGAKITRGYRLPAKFIIHTVGPVYGHENNKEAKLLTECYKNCMELAKIYRIKTIALPAISTGLYGFPKQEAAKIAIKTIKNFVKKNDCFDEICFVLFNDENLYIYQKLLIKI